MLYDMWIETVRELLSWDCRNCNIDESFWKQEYYDNSYDPQSAVALAIDEGVV